MEGGQAQLQTDGWNQERPEQEVEKPEPRIYVASLSDYNAGILHGAWIDATLEQEEIQEAITAMLQASPSDGAAEEWAIHDFEGFNGLHLGEWEDLAHVSKVARGIKEHGPAYAHWATLVSTDEELDQFEEHYLGEWPSRTRYAEDVLDDLGLYDQVEKSVPENLRSYVTLDAEGFGRDLEVGGDISVVESGGGCTCSAVDSWPLRARSATFGAMAHRRSLEALLFLRLFRPATQSSGFGQCGI